MLDKNKTLLVLLGLLLAGGIISGISWIILLKLGINPEQNTSSSSTNLFKVQRFSEVKKVPEGLFNYGGSTTWVPIQATVNPVIEIVFPRFLLRHTNPINSKPGSGTGIKMLLEDQLSFALSSRPLTEAEYQQSKNKGFNFQEIPVAIDAIAVAVHPSLDVPGLTISQLKDIYTGKISNWSQLGGQDIPITLYSRSPEASGTVEFFVENILEGEAFAKTIQLVDNTTIGVQQVFKNIGGIYYASAPELVSQCTIKTLPMGQKVGEWISPYQEPFVPLSQCPTQRNRVNRQAFLEGNYPITRRLFVIVKRNKSLDERAGLAYANLLLTKEGQDLINKSGFVGIR